MQTNRRITPDAALSDGTKVTSLLEMANAVAKNPHLSQCITDTLYGYGLGRSLGPADRDVLDGIRSSGSLPEGDKIDGIVSAFKEQFRPTEVAAEEAG